MVELGPFVIRLYGVMVGLGILVGFWVAARMAEKFSLRSTLYALRSEQVWNALWWVAVPAVVGARLYHVVDLWGYYRENLALIPAVWTGGLGIFGAIFGGFVGLWLYCLNKCVKDIRAEVGYFTRLLSMVAAGSMSFIRVLPGFQPGRSSQRSKTPSPRDELFQCTLQRFLGMVDLIAFGLPVGQAIGRWGNFFNQELYGLPTDLAWGLAIPLEKRLPGFEQNTHFHPLFLYESLYSILVFGILLILWRVKGGKLAPGSYFSMYLVMYGIGRYFLERFRIESWALAGINVAQALSLLMLVSGVYYLYSKNRE